MKTKLVAIAALLLASVYPSTASAQDAIPGQVGSITVNLTVSYEDGGFNGEYTKTTGPETNFVTSYKSIIVKSKYSNKEFISDMINRYELPGKVADYTIKFVTNGEFGGYFIVNKAGTSITCIGSSTTDSYSDSTPINTYYVNDYTNPNNAESGSKVGKLKGDTYFYTEKYKKQTEQCATYIYFNPLNQSYFETFGLLNSSGSYSATYTDDHNNFVEKTTIGATTVSGLIGTDYDGTTLTGSFTVSAMSDVADVSAYVSAYNDVYGS